MVALQAGTNWCIAAAALATPPAHLPGVRTITGHRNPGYSWKPGFLKLNKSKRNPEKKERYGSFLNKFCIPYKKTALCDPHHTFLKQIPYIEANIEGSTDLDLDLDLCL